MAYIGSATNKSRNFDLISAEFGAIARRTNRAIACYALGQTDMGNWDRSAWQTEHSTRRDLAWRPPP